MNQNELYQALRKTAWGYILIHVNVNLGSINILPDWLGYLIFVSVIPILAREIESIKLLKQLATAIAVVEVLYWINDSLFAGAYDFYLMPIIIGAISLYFHFQFLTNLSEIAGKYKCKEEKNILKLRTVNTICMTIMIVFISWEANQMIMTGLLVLLAVVVICICRELFSLSNSVKLKMKETEDEVMVDD